MDGRSRTGCILCGLLAHFVYADPVLTMHLLVAAAAHAQEDLLRVVEERRKNARRGIKHP